MSAQPILLDVADGAVLDGDIDVPAAPRASVVLAHPHPLYGGNRYSNVVDAFFRALPPLAIAVLRFDFRGVGRSTGDHDDGRAERLDVAAAIDALVAIVPDAPILVAGYSFGAEVALNVTDARLAGWFAVAPPLAGASVLAAPDHRHKLLAVPEHDQYNPPERARERVSDWNNTAIVVIPGGDHFLAGRVSLATNLLGEFVDSFVR